MGKYQEFFSVASVVLLSQLDLGGISPKYVVNTYFSVLLS